MARQEVVYEEFEPFCIWRRMIDRDVLQIHLQGFKKEELKVQISNQGVLKIYGERAADPPEQSKRINFCKEVSAPSNKYDSNAIHAKLTNGNLIITLPKQKPQANDKLSPSDQPSKADQPRCGGDGGAKNKAPTHLEENVPMGQCGLKSRKKPMMGSRLAKVAASLAATAMAAVVLAAYVHYMYKSVVDD